MIDYHVHWFPPTLVEYLKNRKADPLVAKFSDLHVDLDVQFANMDAHGIDTIVVSSSPIGDPPQLGLAEARELATIVNEEYSRAQRERGNRFVGLATLPLQ